MTTATTEKVDQQLDLLFDFIRYLVEHPSEIDKIPDHSILRFRAYNRPMQTLPVSEEEQTFWVDVKQDFRLSV